MYRKDIRTNRTSTIFERAADTVDFGASVRKECDLYKEQIPAETLVLSFFNRLKLKTEVFRRIYTGIGETLVIPADFCEDTGLLEKYLPKLIDHEKDKLVQFLTAIDSGIKDLYYESEGTIKSIMLFIYARAAILGSKSLFVDELNGKLHPLLLKFIIDLFYVDNSQAQLIYTTHDTTLMDKKFFRRDQIWFVQKDEFGYSELVSLSDYKVRSDASFEKDYLAGVYGGIPFLNEFHMKEGE